ncbi:hypothetical protein Goshw_002223, partial [Gossypium schwendimanii]|nr:hypothetical protein [Gossypium schwendimanii]
LFKATDWLQVTFKHPSLLELHLSYCGLEGPSPIIVNSLEGPIPDYFGNMSFLEVLDLSLNHLRVLDLSYNGIKQDIAEILQSLSRCCLDSLKSLYMADNSLFGELSFLKFFDVSENQLNGTFPLCFGQLESLETLDFGYNLLEGVVLETHFSKLSRLTTLKASQNRLRFEPNPSWIPPFQCEIIELSHWHLGSKFPQWLKFQNKLSVLDISDAGISDVMPTWFLNLPAQFEKLNLSFNQLTGEISNLNVTDTIDLSSNRFTGPLPRVLSSLRILFLSNNSFSGSLSEFICNPSISDMIVLFIDTNLLIGEIPDCWIQWRYLGYLNLENNNLTGNIPFTFGFRNLFMLNLRNNSMFGEFSSNMQSFVSLIMLDLSENHFSGSVPAWIGDKLLNLVILSLRSNNFDGHIPQEICDLRVLQILDLARNNISGTIPKCFNKLGAMATKQKIYNKVFTPKIYDFPFYLSELLVLKGREDEYGHTLGLVTSIDLSANSLIGEIPKEIGSLVGLLSLNFSRNFLTGRIPNNIGNMELMESLDLSMNRLNGEIPPSFSKLNFLNHFNVSYNNLTGQIPTSTQLQSFENLSYVGNHLCGPPLTKNCTSKGILTDATNNGSSSDRNKVNWLYVSIILGFVMGFWGVVAPLFFFRSWRIAYYQKLDHICGKLY